MYMTMRRSEQLTFQDIAAFESVMRVKLTPMEVEGILAMDKGASAAIAQIMSPNKADPNPTEG